MASVLNVAQYVLNKVGDMTTLKLQKIGLLLPSMVFGMGWQTIV